jgi:hypothetical protein
MIHPEKHSSFYLNATSVITVNTLPREPQEGIVQKIRYRCHPSTLLVSSKSHPSGCRLNV